MASKKDKFASTLGALPTKQAVSSNSTAALQSIVEGGKPEYRFIRLENITFNPNNDYALDDTEQEISDLADDIRRNGLLHNIVVSFHSDGSYLLLSGERRVRAYMLLHKQEPNESKWESIYALIRKELSGIEETIILDAANLQARGAGAKSEARYRKSTARFVENLQAHFKISEGEAVNLTKTYASASDSTISRNINIEKSMLPELKELLDKGYIKKVLANSYARLTAEEQLQIAESYKELIKQNSDISAFESEAADALKNNRPIKPVSAKPLQKPATARQRQRDALLKSCKRMDKTIDELTAKAKLMKRMDEDATEDSGEKLSDTIDALYEKLGKLRSSLK